MVAPVIDRQHLFGHLQPVHGNECIEETTASGRLESRSAIRAQTDTDSGMGQGVVGHRRVDVTSFGLWLAEEFQARRHVSEKMLG